jgi:uroporphyrinogen-III synthase
MRSLLYSKWLIPAPDVAQVHTITLSLVGNDIARAPSLLWEIQRRWLVVRESRGRSAWIQELRANGRSVQEVFCPKAAKSVPDRQNSASFV